MAIASVSAISLPSVIRGLREVVTCNRCALVQYLAKSCVCRRCHGPLFPISHDLSPAAPSPLPQPPSMDCKKIEWKVGVVLRDIRRKKKWSQRALARRMEKPRTYVSKIELGGTVPSVSSIERFAEALGVSAYVIMIEATMPPEEAAVRADRFLMEEMFPYLFTLNERAREIVLSCAKRIADVRLSGVPFKSKE